MGLTWTLVLIAGCEALAACIAAALLRPMRAERRRLRPLANARRLTQLPEYKRAARARTRTAVVTIALLLLIFVGSVLVGARPTGLPTSATKYEASDPEDIMVCVGAPATDAAAGAAFGYFAEHVTGFTTQRIGLTSYNRRAIPLTRDYQYAGQVFSEYARPAEQRGDVAPLVSAVSYEDYSANVEDLLASCLTGFPGFDRPAAQRRSLIYVGPEPSPRPDALFSADRVRELAAAAGVQVNAVVTGSDSGALAPLVRDTGGRSFPATNGVPAALDDIRGHPPENRVTDRDSQVGAATESPDVPALVALAAAVALALWPVVQRR